MGYREDGAPRNAHLAADHLAVYANGLESHGTILAQFPDLHGAACGEVSEKQRRPFGHLISYLTGIGLGNLVAGDRYGISDEFISTVIPQGIRGRRPNVA